MSDTKLTPQLLSEQIASFNKMNNRDRKQFNKSDQLFFLQHTLARFYGFLLCVDISGFTNLSVLFSKDVTQMYTEINKYFKEMIQIIYKFGGDVIKFAGDAMFVVWKSPKGVLHVSFFLFLKIF